MKIESEEIKDYKVPPLYSVADIEKKSFKTLPFEGDWKELIGTPEVSGCWIIWGLSGNGKTRFALQLAKYMASFQRVYYNSLEEGLKLSFKNALSANNMKAVGNRFGYHKESLWQMRKRLEQKRSPNIIFIDSLQYLNPTKEEVKKLLANGFIRDVFYPKWLANPVLVKSNGKWRTCVDYTYLNKAIQRIATPFPK